MKRLRNFVKLDASNHFVIGSNIKRDGRPLRDRWYEIYEPNCCLATAPVGTPGVNTYTIVTVSCGDSILAELDAHTVNLVVVASILNAAYPAMGEFTGSSTELTLLSSICPDISISIRYATAPSAGTTTTSTTTSTTSTTLPTTTSTTTSTSTTTVPVTTSTSTTTSTTTTT